MNKLQNYYELLDLSHECRMEDIEKAYQIARNTYGSQSPALYSLYDADENTQILRKIEEAYSVLSSSEKRKEYDAHNGFLTKALSDPEKAFEEGKTDELANDQSKYTSTLKSSNVNVSTYTSIKKYALDFTIDPDFEKEIEEEENFTGEFLRKIREYRNVDLPRMVELTKISKSNLTNIEMENYKDLPARIYTRGYLYQYAKCLKLNADKVIKSYLGRIPNDDN